MLHLLSGLTHVETTVQAIVEIIHAFTTCDPENTVPIAAQLYLELLLCEDTTISFSAKQALVRVLRPRGQVPRIVTTQPHCTIPSEYTIVQIPLDPVYYKTHYITGTNMLIV